MKRIKPLILTKKEKDMLGEILADAFLGARRSYQLAVEKIAKKLDVEMWDEEDLVFGR